MISIVVPVYNVEKYLKQCVDSILSQTYKDFELLLINDGSLDNSLSICKEYEKKDSRIKVYDKSNEGLGLTRNYGIKKSSGDFIVFLDSDDFIEANAIEDLYEVVEKEGCDTCFGGHNRVDIEGNYLSSQKYEKAIFKNSYIKNDLIPRVIGSLPDKKDSISTSACYVLYSLKVIRENNILFNSERNLISEDLIFNIDYLSKSKSVCLLDKCNYNYRTNNNSLTTVYNKRRFELIKVLYEFEVNRLKELEIYDRSALRLKKQFFIYLRMCLKQEKASVSKFKFSQTLKNLRIISSDELVMEIINSYPINKLHLKQRLFVILIKNKFNFLLYILINLGKV